jgi:DUF4097 and DUF4098 domain-containing protein YvlB
MERTFETAGALRVVVVNAVGRVSIAAAETTSTHVTLDADTADAEELVERATVESAPFGDGHVVTVKVPQRHGLKFMRRNGVSIMVTLPAGADIEVVTASADIDLTGALGNLNLKTASGDVDADGRAGEVKAMTSSGDVVIGQAAGPVTVKSASGDLRVSQSDGSLNAATASGSVEVGAVTGRLEVRCTSGDVRLGYVSGDAHIVAVSGDIRVSSYATGRLHVRSVSGDVAVGIAPGATLSVDAESMSGAVRSDIPLSDTPSATKGAPDVIVTARSVSGAVIIERAAEAMAV